MGGQWEDREGQFQDSPPPETLRQRTLTFSPSGPAGPLSPSRPGSPWKAWWEKTRRHDWGGASCAFPSSPSLEQDPQPLISGQWGLAHTRGRGADFVNEQGGGGTHSVPRKERQTPSTACYLQSRLGWRLHEVSS